MFTSGTTGRSKAVAVGHQQLIYYVVEMIEKYNPSQYDRFSQVIELTFDLSVHDIFLAWITGAALLVFSGEDYFQLNKYIETKHPTFWLSVPSTGLALDRAKLLSENKYQSLRVVMFCGEPLPYQLASKWQQACPHASIENIYGPTEATIAFTSHHFGKCDANISQKIVPIGKPFPGLRIKIVRKDLSECTVLENGELLLAGPQIVEGYLYDAEKTKEKFIKAWDGLVWYKTGDIVFEDKNHVLHYKGRIDDQFQIRGQRVERLDLEIAFREVLKTSNIAIIPSPITEDGLILGIVLIYIENDSLKKDEIIKKCKECFGSPFLPNGFIGVDGFPLNQSGKVDYKILKERYQKTTYDKKSRYEASIHG